MSDIDGAEALLGVVVPYDMALDAELWRWAPADVSLLFTRTPYVDLPVTVEMAETVGDAGTVADGVRALHVVGPQAYAYGCTSGSFVRGVAGEREIVAAMTQAGSAPAVTTSGAILAALDALGVSSVAAITPYDEAVTERFSRFLTEAGHPVVGSAHLGLHERIWEVDYATTRDLVRAGDDGAADAIVISCTNLPTYGLIAELEDELGKPVISANQATMWALLRLVARRGVGSGQRLFDVD